MKVGNDNNLKNRISSTRKNIDESYEVISFRVGPDRKRFDVPLEETLVVDVLEAESSLTEEQVLYQAEKSSYYQWVAYRAYLDQRKHAERLYAQYEKRAEDALMSEKGEDGVGFSKSQLVNLLSSSKLRNWILRHDDLGPALQRAEEDADALKKLADVINDRSYTLNALLKRFQADRKEDF